MKFKKIDSDQHGPIVNVITDQGFQIGTVAKWHGLFVPTDWKGEKFTPAHTRKCAASRLLDNFHFEKSKADAQ